MDSKIYNGDHVQTGNSIAEVSGNAELLQRALIRLAVRKGEFTPDPTLGSRLYTLRTCKHAQLTAAARALGNEALLPMGLEVSAVNATVLENGVRLDYYLNGFDEPLVLTV